jgi:hypothetical protein
MFQSKSFSSRIAAIVIFALLVLASPLAFAGSIVFEDTLNPLNTSVGGSTAFVNHIPDIGNGGAPWNGINPNGLTINTSTPPYVETQGNQRTFSATLASTLGPNQIITEQVNQLQTSGTFWNGYTGFTLEAGSTPVAFLGHVNGSPATYSLASSETAGTYVAASTAVTETQLATLTYNYNTGAASLTLSGAQGVVTVNEMLASHQAINTIFFDNNGGADQRFGPSATGTPAILVSISQVTPEPSSFLLCGLGAIGLFVAARRRRKA